MDEYDLETYRALSGIYASLVPLSLFLVARYLPRWWHGFFATYRTRDRGRLRAWKRWTGIVALLLGLALVIVLATYLELTEDKSLLSTDFYAGLGVGAVGAPFLAAAAILLLMTVRKVVMLARRAKPYDRQEQLSLGEARSRARKEINALQARLADVSPGQPGRQRSAEYLEVARRLMANWRNRTADPLWEDLFARGAVAAVIAAALCQVARSALENGEPAAEEQALCLFDPLHGPAHGTHEMSLTEQDAAAYPLCHACLLHVRTVPEPEWKGRMLTLLPLSAHNYRVPFLDTAVLLMNGDTRPSQFFELTVAVLDSSDQDSRR